MLLPICFLALAALTVVLYRYFQAKRDSRALWRSSLAIGSSAGLVRAVLACIGWYGVGHTGGPLQIPAYALAMLALPEGIALGRHQGPVPLSFYVSLGLVLIASSLLFVNGVALVVQLSRGQGDA
jgi:hypothetical protein